MSIKKDHNRFRDIVKGRIKENFQKYLTQEEMIGKQEKEFVKIPIPRIKIPKFSYGPKQSGGVGQGQGEAGEGTGEAQSEDGKAGNSEGQHLTEVDVSIDDLAEILSEKLELPRIKPKGQQKITSEKTKYTGIAPIGPPGLRHFKRTYKETLKRSIATGTYSAKNPVLLPIKADYRYKSFKVVEEKQTQAAVIYIMDVSGSMGKEQKKIVRMTSFWINTWLKHNYKNIETEFIIHDAAARIVDEETFFSTSESGGTLISSAYKITEELLNKKYKTSEWNTYVFQFSDGDNWSGDDTKICIETLKKSFLPYVNLFGYGQVESRYGSGQYLKDLDKEFDGQENLVTSLIKDRMGIIEAIKAFLGKGN